MTQYAYSFDEETYEGSFDSPEEAAEEAFASEDHRESVMIAEIVPVDGTDWIHASHFLDSIQLSDDYLGEWAEDWPKCTQEQEDELTRMLRRTFGQWLYKHGLRPTFFNVKNPKEIKREVEG